MFLARQHVQGPPRHSPSQSRESEPSARLRLHCQRHQSLGGSRSCVSRHERSAQKSRRGCRGFKEPGKITRWQIRHDHLPGSIPEHQGRAGVRSILFLKRPRKCHSTPRSRPLWWILEATRHCPPLRSIPSGSSTRLASLTSRTSSAPIRLRSSRALTGSSGFKAA
jgi:hypothetical protein